MRRWCWFRPMCDRTVNPQVFQRYETFKADVSPRDFVGNGRDWSLTASFARTLVAPRWDRSRQKPKADFTLSLTRKSILVLRRKALFID